jgi:hypothetical protein
MENGLSMLAEIKHIFLNTLVLAVLTVHILFSVNTASTAVGRG